MFPKPISQSSMQKTSVLVARFKHAEPVRHVVIDNFLDEEAANQLIADFPAPDQMPKSRDYMFSDKYELSTIDKHSAASKLLHEAVFSEAFVEFLGELVGHKVFIDPTYVGGGFHAGPQGSFLDLHTDFNIHPVNRSWFRELNILLYLNPGWQESWGGELILTSDPAVPGIKVAPVHNRLVIMESTDRSFHGYERLHFPEDAPRRSIAAYAYSLVDEGSIRQRTTNWEPVEASFAKRFFARNWNTLVLTKNRLFGSGTVKNRRLDI